ncbi:unnamed protein product [Mucor hiemalis]
MSESRIKRLWKNRISHQLTGLHFSTCLTKGGGDTDKYNDNPSPISPAPPTPPSHSSQNKLWRKPLPNDCPVFNFDKTLYPVRSMDEKTEIPTRCDSRHYENIPNLEAQLDRACTNERAVLLTKLLQKKTVTSQ